MSRGSIQAIPPSRKRSQTQKSAKMVIARHVASLGSANYQGDGMICTNPTLVVEAYSLQLYVHGDDERFQWLLGSLQLGSGIQESRVQGAGQAARSMQPIR